MGTTYALVVEMLNLLAEGKVLQERGTAAAGLQAPLLGEGATDVGRHPVILTVHHHVVALDRALGGALVPAVQRASGVGTLS